MWKTHQRVISKNEPELGIGIVECVDVSSKSIEINFPISDQSRSYSLQSLPLKRAVFQKGEYIRDLRGSTHIIENVLFNDGLAFYKCGAKSISEEELNHNLTIQKSSEISSILTLNLKKSQFFNLRKEALTLQEITKKSLITALTGAKIELLPHQLYLTHKISQRPSVRVLLADEVGLGKTIEAALILSSLKSQGRADKVLIITPDNLIHQWMVELYQRFGLMFSVLDKERCQQEISSQKLSAFDNHQNILMPLSMLSETNENTLEQITKQDWGLVIIDEAHHLSWDFEAPDKMWETAYKISQNTQHLILLTATPRQRGISAQFGLLHLLDPQKYNNFKQFLDDHEQMNNVATLVRNLLSSNQQQKEDAINKLKELFSQDHELIGTLKKDLDKKELENVVSLLIDRHGTGRVFFQNKRSNIPGFPKRKLVHFSLQASPEYKKNIEIYDPTNVPTKTLLDIATGRKSLCAAQHNPKFYWLREFIKNLASNEKILIIYSKLEGVKELINYLGAQIDPNKIATFHEGISLIARDREAANFYDPKGANILVASHVGGEGRNFQFVQKLVLLDLPATPETLEQRIGRIDRIGQKHSIEIIVPYLKDTPEEALFYWYKKGLMSFSQFQKSSGLVFEEHAEELIETLKIYLPKSTNFNNKKSITEEFTKKISTFLEKANKDIGQSSDILIDLNSFNSQKAKQICEEIEDLEDNPQLEVFIRNFLDLNEIDYEEFDSRGSILVKDIETLPFRLNLNKNDKKNYSNIITFDRETAIQRESFPLMSYGSVFAQQFISSYLDSDDGKLSICKTNQKNLKSKTICQFIFRAKGSGPQHLQIERYLPHSSQLINILDETSTFEEQINESCIDEYSEIRLTDIKHSLAWQQIENHVSNSYEKAKEIMNFNFSKVKEDAAINTKNSLTKELERLQYLQTVNKNIGDRDLSNQMIRISETLKYLNNSCFYLDSIRVVLG